MHRHFAEISQGPVRAETKELRVVSRSDLKQGGFSLEFIVPFSFLISTSWHRQQYCRGSYTAIAVGGSQEDIDNVAQPLYSSPHQSKPAILFAGEHTHSNFYSTVHGAYLSGRTAAQIILTPDSPQEIIMESDSSDLSAWIQGIALE